MKFTAIISALCLSVSAVVAEDSVPGADQIPAEAVLGYLNLGEDQDVGIIPMTNATSNGILFINTTIAKQAISESAGTDLAKREADAKWHWLELEWGQPLYKRSADADAKWHWLELEWGQPLYKRSADADAKWHWLELEWGQPLY